MTEGGYNNFFPAQPLKIIFFFYILIFTNLVIVHILIIG